MPEIEPAHDDARDQPDGVALRSSEQTPPLHAASETDLEPSSDLRDHDGGGPTGNEPAEEGKDSAWRRFLGSTPFLIFVALAVAIEHVGARLRVGLARRVQRRRGLGGAERDAVGLAAGGVVRGFDLGHGWSRIRVRSR